MRGRRAAHISDAFPACGEVRVHRRRVDVRAGNPDARRKPGDWFPHFQETSVTMAAVPRHRRRRDRNVGGMERCLLHHDQSPSVNAPSQSLPV
jgi:hypothetical protein